MKGSRIYILCIVAFLVIMFVIEYNMPKKFIWRPTFSQYDKQPFGCFVFDDILKSSLPDGYEVSPHTIYQLYEDSLPNTGFILIDQNIRFIDAEREAILEMAEQGHKFLLVSSSFDYHLRDTLNFSQSYDYFSIRSLKKYASSEFNKRDSLIWEKDSLYDTGVFTSFPHLVRSYFREPDSTYEVLAIKSYNETFYEYDSTPVDTLQDALNRKDTTQVLKKYAPVAMKKKIGEGEIILVSTPLLFTNYGILDGQNVDYIFRLLTQMKGMPIVRVDAYTGITAESQTPLRYILSERPLRWALYSTMILILLFMIFTARRRQRVIPVVREPQNRSIEFAELVGTLYYQRKDHRDLVMKKYIYFAETLRRMIQVNIEDETDDAKLAHRISLKTGIEEPYLKELLEELRMVSQNILPVDEVRMKNLIDRINNVVKHLN